MALSDQNEIRERIASVNIKNKGPVDIYYIGGSMFEFDFRNNTSNPVRCRKQQIDKLVSQGKLKLVAPSRYQEIIAGIDPVTGDTKTHRADGSVKTKRSQIIDMLASEEILVPDGDGKLKVAEDEEKPKPTAKRVPRRRSVTINTDSLKDDPQKKFPETEDIGKASKVNESRSEGLSANQAKESSSQEKTGAGKPVEASDPFADFDDAEESLNDGNDENQNKPTEKIEYEKEPPRRSQKLRNKPQTKNSRSNSDKEDHPDKKDASYGGLLLTGVTFLVFLLCCGLFIGSHMLTSMLVPNSGTSGIELPFIGKIGGDKPAENKNENNGNANKNTDNPNNNKITHREDFDPENAVKDMPLADDAKKDIAVGFFETLRTNIVAGDLKTISQMIALEALSSQLASAYGDYAAQLKGLTATEKDALISSWNSTFLENEKKHIVEKDVNASLFGGRIREVRQDPSDPYRLYIVMESLSGDHQRGCYIIQGNDSNVWVLSGMMDAPGYIKMISYGN